MPNTFRRMAELTGAAMTRRVREMIVDPRAFRSAVRRAHPSVLSAPINSVEIGSAAAGEQLLKGEFRLAGRTVEVDHPDALWLSKAETGAWAEAAHRFAWLADLAALGDARAARFATTTVFGWIGRYRSTYHPIAWRTDVTADRLLNWIFHSALVTPTDGDESRAATLVAAYAEHAEWLSERLESAPAGLPRLKTASALTIATLLLGGWEERRDDTIERLDAAMATSVKEDGGVVGRRPDDVYTALVLLGIVADAFDAAQTRRPPALAATLRALAAALRFFRQGDGGAAMFHGGRAINDGRIDLALARAPFDGPIPKTMPESGYARMTGGRVAVILDVGRAPSGAHAENAHASCLAFEMVSGRRRVVVNCGSGVGRDDEWNRACRHSLAHSTLIVDDEASARPTLDGRWRAFGEDRALIGPPETHAERKEERNGVWILGAHDAYFDTYGLTTTRRLFLSVDGGDFRGEDSLEAHDDGVRAFEKRLASDRRSGVPFVARFHLHPDVSAEIVADGEAITLRLPHGEVWVMRQAGGKLTLEPSVYLPDDAPGKPTRQIVVSAAATKTSTQLRWAFRRVGEIAQLPTDIDALLPISDVKATSGPDDLSPSNIIKPRRRP